MGCLSRRAAQLEAVGQAVVPDFSTEVACIMKRKDEEYCKSAFDVFLRRHYRQDEIEWTASEAPDFYLTLRNQSFGVEITTLVETVRAGPRKWLSLIDVLRAFQDTVADVEKRARHDCVLQGAYAIAFGEPIDGFGKWKNILKKELLDYIRNTQTLAQAPEKTIFNHGGQRCSIVKVGNSFTRIQMLGPTGAIYVDGIGQEICHLLSETLKVKKIDKLAHLTLPKVLLILDQYGFGSYGLKNPQVRELCSSRLPELASFHTVFIVEDNDESLVLSSKDDQWVEIVR